MTAARVWTVTMTAPTFWLTANDRRHHMAQAGLVKQWRDAAYTAALVAKLPKGLARVRLDVMARFRGHAPVRDLDNLRPTTKAIVDGLGPQRITRHRSGRVDVAVGYGLIADDDDVHLDGPHLTIGDPLPAEVYSSRGEVVLTITELLP
jgi:hypothetical protein